MSHEEELKGKMEQHQLENARAGYQVATNLWNVEAQMLWSKFNAFLVANSIILAIFAGIKYSNSSEMLLGLRTFFPFFGLALCFLWFLLMARSWQQHEYYVYATREIEETMLNDSVTTVSKGGQFAEGEEVSFQLKGKTKKLKMSIFGKLSTVKESSFITIGLFTLIYILILEGTFLDEFEGFYSDHRTWVYICTSVAWFIMIYESVSRHREKKRT